MYFLVGIPLWADGWHYKASKNCYEIKITAEPFFGFFSLPAPGLCVMMESITVFGKHFSSCINQIRPESGIS